MVGSELRKARLAADIAARRERREYLESIRRECKCCWPVLVFRSAEARREHENGQ